MIKAKVKMLFPDQTKLAQEKEMVGLASLLQNRQWVLFRKASLLAIAEFQNCVWQIHASLFAAAPRIYFYSRALDLAQPTRNPLFSDGNLNWKISAGSQHHNLWNICGGGCSQNCFRRCCLKKHKGSRGEMIWGAVRSSCPD